LSYAKGIGVTRAGVLETTFAEETKRICSVSRRSSVAV
jgi:ketol-acid reductoisomerase